MPEDAEGTDTPKDVNQLPSWARDAISRANEEAASRRVELRTKTDELTAALNQHTALSDAKAEAEKARETANFELLKLTVALNAGIDSDRVVEFAARLRGTTEDELKADAAKALELFGAPPKPRATDPTQGRGDDTPVPNTPEAEFAQFIANQFGSLRK